MARIAQADADSSKAFVEGLQHRLGKPVVTSAVYDPSFAKADPNAKEQLMKIFGGG
nr:hypothetical protein [Photorhabdus asymbiotica]